MRPPIARYSSYCARLVASPSTSYALEISLKRVSLLLSPPLLSGWNCLASLRYAFLMSAAEALASTPRAL